MTMPKHRKDKTRFLLFALGLTIFPAADLVAVDEGNAEMETNQPSAPEIEEEPEELEEPDEAHPPLYEGRIDFSYRKLPDGQREFLAIVTANYEERFVPVEAMPVSFHFISNEEEQPLGAVETDANGQALRILPAAHRLALDEDGLLTFVARIEHDALGSLERRLEIQESILDLSMDEEEGTLRATLMQVFPERRSPVQMEMLNFYVLRDYGRIVFGGDFTFTDEEGEVIVPIPEGFPPDLAGRVQVMALLEDHDDFGSISAMIELPVDEIDERPSIVDERALWARRLYAPWWLLLFVNALLLFFFGTIGYTIFLIAQIKKS
ncbi:MAG: hypothetical protein ACNA8W_01615 [Bradymonadaceae bacterium]